MMDIFGGSGATGVPDYSNEFNQYAHGVRELAPSYDYYVNQGQQAGNTSYDKFNQMVNDPNSIQNMISQGYKESPYQKMLLDRLTQRMNFNAANSGMITSPAAQRALNEELMTMSGQFQNDYTNRGLGLFGQGLSGLDSRNNLGFTGLGEKNSLLERGLSAQLKGGMSAKDAQMAQEMADKAGGFDLLGTAGGILGGIGGFMAGGPSGAMAGYNLGSSLGGRGGMGGGMGGGIPGLGGSSFNLFGGSGVGGGVPLGLNSVSGAVGGGATLPMPFSY